jgi:hypothetical protein
MGARLSSVMSAAHARPPLRTLVLYGVPLEPAHRARLAPLFGEIIHAESKKESIAPSDLEKADVIYGFLPFIEGLEHHN